MTTREWEGGEVISRKSCIFHSQSMETGQASSVSMISDFREIMACTRHCILMSSCVCVGEQDARMISSDKSLPVHEGSDLYAGVDPGCMPADDTSCNAIRVEHSLCIAPPFLQNCNFARCPLDCHSCCRLSFCGHILCAACLTSCLLATLIFCSLYRSQTLLTQQDSHMKEGGKEARWGFQDKEWTRDGDSMV